MEKKIKVKNSNFSFPVKWDEEDQSSWIGIKVNGSSDYYWFRVGTKVNNEKSSVFTAQRYIDLQYAEY